MLIKEYRIVMPMSVDEYQIGQLYTIQKKSRLESQGVGGGVEIIENRPFEDEIGKGQYTFKIYHVDQKLPHGLKHLTKLLFPASALVFEEKGWNMYPHTKTEYRNQLFKKFAIDIETKFIGDLGEQENIFKLSKSELSHRIVEHIDMVNDTLQTHDLNEAEDPKVFKSIKNNRGPLHTNWLDDLKKQVSQNKTKKYMCAYKLCRIECVFWGLQARIEKAISDSIRNMLMITHRQAWCWQDEYLHLKLDDIRKLEEQAQEELKRKMNSHLVNCNNNHIKVDENNNIILHDKANDSTLNDIGKKNSFCESLSYYSDSEDIEDLPNQSNDEFYDAISQISSCNNDLCRKTSPISKLRTTYQSVTTLCAQADDSTEKNYLNKVPLSSQSEILITEKSNKDYLIIVVHGGDVLNSDDCKLNDFQSIKATFDRVLKAHWSHIRGKITFKLMSCENICKDALKHLSSLSPYVEKNHQNADNGYNYLNDNLPFNVLPLFISLNNEQYRNKLNEFVQELNDVYNDFIKNEAGTSFSGDVILIGDSIGSIMAYDMMTFKDSNDYNNHDSSSNINSNASSTNTLESSYPSSPNEHSPIKNNQRDKSSSIQMHHSFKSECSYRPQLSHMKESNFKKSFSHDKLSVYDSNAIRLDFNVAHFFVFGSPLGLILAHRSFTNLKMPKPKCKQLYNLFHLNDPVAIRIEPLLNDDFRSIQPFTIPRYLKSPYGDGSSTYLNDLILNRIDLITDELKNSTINFTLDIAASSRDFKKWWGERRIDYVLYSPEKLITNLPRKSLPYLFHSSYWESSDVVSFVLNTVFNKQREQSLTLKHTLQDNLKIPPEKWMNLSNRLKLRNSTPNHRANDLLFLEDSQQTLIGKFLYAYGPIDLALSNEKVDIYILKLSTGGPKTDWQLLSTEVTDKNGRLKYEIPREKCLLQGTYSVKMQVRYDKTCVEFNLSVLPENTETVIFSITGSFAANISISGSDPKVRAGAIDIARYWQDLGYLLIYISARPDKQKAKITKWLAQHNFPLGMVYFSDGIRPDPIRQKTETLKHLVNQSKLKIKAAYGSQKDISAYMSLGLGSHQIFITGKRNNKRFADKVQILSEGYVHHLNYLKTWLSQANGNARLIIQRTTFNRQNSICNNININNINGINTRFSYTNENSTS